MAIELARITLLAAGAATLAIGGLVLLAGPGRGLNRAFAALLGARGASMMLPQVGTTPAMTLAGLNMQPYFALAVVPVAVYCLLRPWHGRARPRPAAGWWTLAAVLALDAAYALRHSLFHTVEAGTPASGALQAGPGFEYTAFGPLFLVVGLGHILVALLALRFLVEYREMPHGHHGSMRLLVGTGLLLGTLFDATSRLAALANLADGASFPWLPWGWGIMVLPPLAIVPCILAILVLATDRGLAPRPLHQLEGRMLMLCAFAAASGLVRLLNPPDSDPAGQALVLVLMGVWRLAMPLFVAYGFLQVSRLHVPLLQQSSPTPTGGPR